MRSSLEVPSLFGHRIFAITCSLAPADSASYPVSVRRLAGLAPRFLRTIARASALALRSSQVGVTSSLRDFHPLAEARAGRAKKRGRPEAASLDCGEMTARS
jgi:hypothetical protein